MSEPGDETNDPFAPPGGSPEPSPPPPPGWGAPPQGPPPAYGQQPSPYGAPPGYGHPGYGQPPFTGAPYGTTAAPKPSTYLPWAIASTILCCLPLGVASIVFANQVNVKYAVGDYAGAVEASRKARNFAIAAAVIGVIVGVIYFAAANSHS
jgi:Interferon-induced transmembrane protein